MKVLYYSDIFAILKTRIDGLCDTPALKNIVLTNLVQNVMEDTPITKISDDDFMICGSELNLAVVMQKTIGNLFFKYASADCAYTTLLKETNFSKSVYYEGFIKKLHTNKLTKNQIFCCKEVGKNSARMHYFVRKDLLPDFARKEYAEAYSLSCLVEIDDFYRVNKDVLLLDVNFYADNASQPRIMTDSEIEIHLPKYAQPKKEYNPVPEKINTLKGLIKTLILRYQDLSNPDFDDKKRALIKSKISNLMFLLKTQDVYINMLFKKDIKILVDQYEKGGVLTADYIQQFFDIYPNPVVQSQVSGICR